MSLPIVLWKGHHDDQVGELISRAWNQECLLILCPPQLNDFNFIDLLPEGEISLAGEWQKVPMISRRKARSDYPQNPVLGVFTSGTTHSPKLVLYSKANIEASARSIYGLYAESSITRVFCYPQPFHTFGLTLGYAAAEIFDWEFAAPEGKYCEDHHRAWLQACHQSTLTLGTPTHFIDLASFVGQQELAPRPSLGAIIGGAKVSADLWRCVRDDLKIQLPSIGYGATEASPGITHLPPGLEPKVDGEVGFPLPHLSVELDPQVGLTFSGHSLCLATIQDNCLEFPQSFTLPDLIKVRSEDGIWVYQGRLQWTLNRGGVKMPMEAAEQAVLEHLGIEVLCCSIPDDRLGEELGLLIRVSPEQNYAEICSKVYQFLRESYGINFRASYHLPVENFPTNSNTKWDRMAARLLLLKACVSMSHSLNN